ncbi:MAG: hypothetical protein Alpg2KO_18560 [Alphaproteobacteria bacterium]
MTFPRPTNSLMTGIAFCGVALVVMPTQAQASCNNKSVSYDRPGVYSTSVPPGCNTVKIRAWGAGGGAGDWHDGGYHGGSNTSGGAGGGGGFVTIDALPVTSGQTVKIAVGCGGLPGSSQYGTACAASGSCQTVDYSRRPKGMDALNGGSLPPESQGFGGTGGQATTVTFGTMLTVVAAGGGGGGAAGYYGAGGAGGPAGKQTAAPAGTGSNNGDGANGARLYSGGNGGLPNSIPYHTPGEGQDGKVGCGGLGGATPSSTGAGGGGGGGNFGGGGGASGTVGPLRKHPPNRFGFGRDDDGSDNGMRMGPPGCWIIPRCLNREYPDSSATRFLPMSDCQEDERRPSYRPPGVQVSTTACAIGAGGGGGGGSSMIHSRATTSDFKPAQGATPEGTSDPAYNGTAGKGAPTAGAQSDTQAGQPGMVFMEWSYTPPERISLSGGN